VKAPRTALAATLAFAGAAAAGADDPFASREAERAALPLPARYVDPVPTDLDLRPDARGWRSPRPTSTTP
jgi:hypothetical protein